MDLGLDLGTTHTVVALSDRGNYPVVAFDDELGDAHDHFPTVVADDAGTLVFGFAALEAARRGAPLVRSFKRTLAEPSATPDTVLRIGSREVPLLDVLTGFFRALRDALATASSAQGLLDPAGAPRAVLGVPAQANSAQRFLTLEACRRAGFDVVGMVNEPSAASFEFAHRQARSITSRRNLVIVYDLGGGTFDASLVQLDGTAHEVLDSFGVNRLGGEDFDEVLATVALEQAGRARAELSEGEWATLLDECREAKERVSPQSRRLSIEVPVDGTEVVTVPVDDFYTAATPLVDATTEAIEPLVSSLGPTGDDGTDLEGVAGIYIVGGASALPLVPRLLRARFGRRVHRAPLPSASTAVGLAIAADRTAGFTLRDRLSRGFGVFREREGGAAVSFDPVLDRSLLTAEVVGAPAGAEPVVVTRRYQAAHNIGWFRFVEYSGVDDQGEPRGDLAPVAEIVFPFDPDLQARSAAAGTDAASAAEALRGTPIVRQAGPVVEERYTVDAAGIVSVTITDTGTGYRQEHVLQA
jgi:molecular chaperone DnaK (HSP70)